MQGILLVNNWTNDVNDILDKIRINSIILSNEHKKTYFLLSSRIKWFRVPVIFLSALGSIFGIGLSPYLHQLLISEICSVMSLVVGLIGSLELFLAISTKMENELVQSKELYLLAIEIQKTLLLDVENRNGDGMAYLEDKFNVYSKLIENSYLLECKIMDELTPLPNEFQSKITPKHSSNTNDSPPRPLKMPQRRSKQPIMDVNMMRHPRRVAPLSPNSSDTNKPSPNSPHSPTPLIIPHSMSPFSNNFPEQDQNLPRPHYSASSIHKKKVLVDKKQLPNVKKQKQSMKNMQEIQEESDDAHSNVSIRRPHRGQMNHHASVVSMNDASGRRGMGHRHTSVRKSFVQLTDEEIQTFANRQYNSMRNKAMNATKLPSLDLKKLVEPLGALKDLRPLREDRTSSDQKPTSVRSCDRNYTSSSKHNSCKLSSRRSTSVPIRRVQTDELIAKYNSTADLKRKKTNVDDDQNELSNSYGYGFIHEEEDRDHDRDRREHIGHALMSPTTPNWSTYPSLDPLTLPEMIV